MFSFIWLITTLIERGVSGFLTAGCVALIFFFIQLLLCLKTKRRIVKRIPFLFLIVLLAEFVLFTLYVVVTFPSLGYGYVVVIMIVKYIPILFSMCLAMDGIAWLTAHIIKKRKAKKQNSVTK